MNDRRKTKKQLVAELVDARRRIAELKRGMEEPTGAEEARAYAESIVETVLEPLVMLDEEMRVVSANRSFYRIFKVSPEQTVGELFYDLGNRQWDIPALRGLLEENLPKDTTLGSFEVEKDFEGIGRRTMLVNARRIYREANKTQMILLAIEDVTDLKRAQQELEHLNSVLRAIRNVNQLITKETDRERLIQGVCDNLIETLGYHKAWLALFAESGSPAATADAGFDGAFAPMAERLARGVLPQCGRKALDQPGVVIIRDPPGECSDCPLGGTYGGRAAVTVRLEYAGKIYGFLTASVPAQFVESSEELHLLREVAEDIAFALYRIQLEEERKTADEALQESEERYRSIVDDVLDSSAVGLFILDSDFRVAWINRAMEEYFGIRREDIIGKDKRELIRNRIKDIFEDGDGFARIVLATYDDNTYFENFECHVLADGERQERWLEHWSQPIQSGLYTGGRIEHYYDVSERRVLEEQLRQAQKLESVGRLAGGVAHDFNNLLTGIKGCAGFALRETAPGSQSNQDLTEVLALSDRAANLTRQLLAFSRRQALEAVVLNVNQLLEDQIKMFTRILGEDIDLRFIPASDLGNVRADPGQVDQILMNLAVNARDAMPDGGKLTIETANVELGEEYTRNHAGVTAGPYVMMSISDTGCGMDEQMQERIFDPFFTTKELGKGTGLGLSTVYGIVKQHGGNIWVYSEPGQGTTFKVYLPRVLAEAGELGPKSEFIVGGTETILLVEDDEAVRGVGRRHLEALGYTVLCASCASEADEVAQGHEGHIHLVLTDVVMPDRNGRDLYESLAANQAGLKVLYMSGYTDNAIVHHGVLEQGIPFLQKPFEREDLAAKVRQALEG